MSGFHSTEDSKITEQARAFTNPHTIDVVAQQADSEGLHIDGANTTEAAAATAVQTHNTW